MLVLGLGSMEAQTIRNSNNSTIATIDNNGTIRNSNNSTVGRIESNGDIRDSNNRYFLSFSPKCT